MRRLRVLTISKPYVAAAYRNKLSVLAATQIDETAFDVGLICPPAWGSQIYESDASDGKPNDDLKIWTKILPIAFNGKNHFHFYRGLAAAVREFAPDILNVEEEHYSIVTWQALRLARQMGIKSVFYTWQNIDKNYPPPFSWIEQQIFRTADAAVVGNDEAAVILRRKGFTKPIREIPQMGVELSRFVPRELSAAARFEHKQRLTQAATNGLSHLRPHSFWVGFFGRLVNEKGVADLLRAVAQLKPTAPSSAIPQVQVMIVGDGPEAPALRQLATELRQLNSQVVFVNQIPSQQVASLLQAVDVLCLPSLTRSNWKEQFGRILAEAMAAGAVPLGSSSGEIPRVIGDAGLVFPEGNSAALSAHIDTLRHQPDLLQQLRERGAQRVKERFSNAIVAHAFAQLFCELA